MWKPRVILGGLSMPLANCDCAGCRAAVAALARPVTPMTQEQADDLQRAWLARRGGYYEDHPFITAEEIAKRERIYGKPGRSP